MSYAAINDGFELALGNFQGFGDVNFGDTPYTAQAGRGYLSARLSAYQRSPMALDAQTPNEERGFYQVNVCRPASEGPATARAIADLLVKFFPRAMSIPLSTGQAITVENASAQPSVPSGEWIVIPVLISWFTTEPGG